MKDARKSVSQNISLPANVASQVRSLAKARRLSTSRMLLELIEQGMEAEKRKEEAVLKLGERFRNRDLPSEVMHLGDQIGRMVLATMARVETWGTDLSRWNTRPKAIDSITADGTGEGDKVARSG